MGREQPHHTVQNKHFGSGQLQRILPVPDRDEQKANVIRFRAVALRTCSVSYAGPSGLRHSAEVPAESIYEAA
jgi:hypothetical protein